MPWQEKTLVTGQALGRTAQAEEVVAETEALLEAAREENPEFEGATASVSFLFDGQPGAYASADTRARLMGDLGFETPAEFDELAGDAFFFNVSPEQVDDARHRRARAGSSAPRPRRRTSPPCPPAAR